MHQSAGVPTHIADLIQHSANHTEFKQARRHEIAYYLTPPLIHRGCHKLLLTSRHSNFIFGIQSNFERLQQRLAAG